LAGNFLRVAILPATIICLENLPLTGIFFGAAPPIRSLFVVASRTGTAVGGAVMLTIVLNMFECDELDVVLRFVDEASFCALFISHRCCSSALSIILFYCLFIQKPQKNLFILEQI
jgi:hypothetical protein